MPSRSQFAQYLPSTSFIDSDHPDVVDFARRVVASRRSDVEKAIALYYAVRDGIHYDPYRIDLKPEAMRASAVLNRGFGFCVPKATLLSAVARVEGIPSRLGFADVKNHLATEKLRRVMQTDVFAFHGYAELFLEDQWVKATPAFNASLCERFDVAPLEFDGRHDAVLQECDRKGNRYMEYIRDHGQFADLPLEQMLAAFEEYYPSLMSDGAYDLKGSFEEDAASDRAPETSGR
jgi:transglutaminase-like putative cysteine protease